jgi:hypothetical protein
VNLEDGGIYAPNKIQKFLFDAWRDCLDEAEHYLNQRDGHRRLILMGDLTEGYHHGTTQVISTNTSLQVGWALELMAEVMEIGFDDVLIIKGTKAHVGPSASLENGLAHAMQAELGANVIRDKEADQPTWYYWGGKMGGTRVDIAHHGRMGQRPWTKGNVVNNLAAEIFHNHSKHAARIELETGKPQLQSHPHLALRAHQHRYHDTYDASPTRLVATPSFQAPTEYIHRLSPGEVSSFGMVAGVLDGPTVEIEPILRTPPRSAWR